MSITILCRGKHIRFSYRLKKRQFVASIVLLLSIFFIAGRSINTPSENIHRIHQTQTGLEQQKSQVLVLKQRTNDKLLGITMKIAEAESQIHRINALGQQLVKQAGLSSNDFNFSAEMATGGPIAGDNLPELALNLDVIANIDNVIHSIEDKQKQLELLESIMLGHHISEVTQIEGRPVSRGWLSSFYGIRKDPFNGLPAMHKGLDFAGKDGDPVIATGAGIVVWSGERYGYGNLIELDHGTGIRTRYAHNKSLSVDVGEVVTKGQQVAVMGSTGRSTGAHVHYEVLKDGVQQDPLRYVSKR